MNLYEMTLPYGSVSDGTLRCAKSFQLEIEKTTGTCMVVTVLAAYTGETAPETDVPAEVSETAEAESFVVKVT